MHLFTIKSDCDVQNLVMFPLIGIMRMHWNTLNHTYLFKLKLGEWVNEAVHLFYGSSLEEPEISRERIMN